ncbi:MAG: hypothetical protein HYT37_01390 [Candidatus Sungbacteria bacterium]|nr:hypothetical protein [Candidatus Sungbacteria bacterium]
MNHDEPTATSFWQESCRKEDETLDLLLAVPPTLRVGVKGFLAFYEVSGLIYSDPKENKNLALKWAIKINADFTQFGPKVSLVVHWQFGWGGALVVVFRPKNDAILFTKPQVPPLIHPAHKDNIKSWLPHAEQYFPNCVLNTFFADASDALQTFLIPIKNFIIFEITKLRNSDVEFLFKQTNYWLETQRACYRAVRNKQEKAFLEKQKI